MSNQSETEKPTFSNPEIPTEASFQQNQGDANNSLSNQKWLIFAWAGVIVLIILVGIIFSTFFAFSSYSNSLEISRPLYSEIQDTTLIEEEGSEFSESTLANIQSSVETYTTQFFPSLKLSYDSSWNFSIQSSPVTNNISGINGLLNRAITLTKNETTVKFDLNYDAVVISTGGSPDFEDGIEVKPGVYRYKQGDEFVYASRPNKQINSDRLGFLIESNDVNLDGDVVYAKLKISINAKDLESLAEAEEIIVNSYWETVEL